MSGIVLEFFLPKPLTVIFAVPLVGVFAYGAVAVEGFRRRLPEALESLAGEYETSADLKRDVSPREFLELRLREQTVVAIGDDTPGILVTIGILGTFVGLGMAVQDAALVMSDAENGLVAMRGLLETIGFKFQASVLGIFLSLAFLLGVTRPLGSALETAMETTTLRLLPSYRPPQVALMEDFHALRTGFDGFRADAQRQTSAATALLERLPDHLEGITGAGNKLVEAAEKMQDLSGEIDRSLRRVSERLEVSVQEAAQRQGDAAQAMADRIQQGLQEMKDAQAGQQTVLAGSLNSAIAAAATKQAGATSKMERMLVDAFAKLDEQQVSVSDGLSKVAGGLDALNLTSGQITAFVDAAAEQNREALAAMTTTMVEIRGILSRMNDVLLRPPPAAAGEGGPGVGVGASPGGVGRAAPPPHDPPNGGRQDFGVDDLLG